MVAFFMSLQRHLVNVVTTPPCPQRHQNKFVGTVQTKFVGTEVTPPRRSE